MQPAQALVFTCPTCHQEIRIDAGMRDPLLSSGCVVCGAAVTNTAFKRM